MKAVIDEDLPRSFGAVLSKLGFTPLDIRDNNLRGAPDNEIYAFAQKQRAVLFSADLGFSNTLYFPLGSHCGICILRFPNEMSVKEINKIVEKLLKLVRFEDYRGNLLILTPGKLRLRRFKKIVSRS